jgi:1-acyl-sn-glycerol-3-phosphate acyltransferase
VGTSLAAPRAHDLHRGVLPLAIRRFLHAWIRLAVHLFYRLQVRGGENLPARGPAIVVANHVSYADCFVLGAASEYPLRFVYWNGLDRVPIVGRVCRACGGIPIASAKEDPELLATALEEVDDALANGEVVAIFPEGALTRDGEIGDFRAGIERVLSRRPVPVVPAALRGLWGSKMSRASRKRFALRPALEVLAAHALPPTVTAAFMRAEVSALRGAFR